MDKIVNPFSPGAGAPPPELAGRDELIEDAQVLLGRVRLGKPEKSFFLTGLRGVGKTVLLNKIGHMAEDNKYRIVMIEASEDKSLAVSLIPHLRKLLFDLDRIAGAGEKVKRGMAVLRSFIGTVKISVGGGDGFGLDFEPEQGSADSGDLDADLSSLFIAVAEAAQSRETAIALFIDEVQYFNSKELGALVMAMHKMQQLCLPLVLVAAGLPILPGLVGDAKSYAERLFNFPTIGPLPLGDANKALQDPVMAKGVSFTADALAEIFRMTNGYPYFLQEWGYQVWNHAQVSPITIDVVRHSTETVSRRLDANFFRVRIDRLTPKEKQFLRAMAEMGAGPYRSSDIAEMQGVKISKLGPVRDSLIKKGMAYSPAYGELAFTVPLFDDFMRRTMPFDGG